MVQRTVWQDDREVMRGHYAHRRLVGHVFTDEDNFPKALTRWLPFMHHPTTDADVGGGAGLTVASGGLAAVGGSTAVDLTITSGHFSSCT